MKTISKVDLKELRAKNLKEQEKKQRIQDLELTLAEQVAAYAEVAQRLQDAELTLADLLAKQ
jgi:uncharacterized coiled-coil protein SlyX